jgi:hypothetical protein
MHQQNATPWCSFAIDRNDFYCMPFDAVRHVIHVDDFAEAARIGRLNGLALYDDAKLSSIIGKASVWLTPDVWPNGYRIGNVALEYPWTTIVQGKRCYWLGTSPAKLGLCRIWVTGREEPGMREFDPTIGDGPWWHDRATQQNYWNSRISLEFIVDAPLDLAGVTRVSCVDHHPKSCSFYGDSCPDIGRHARRAGARLMAKLMLNPPPAGNSRITMSRFEWRPWWSAFVHEVCGTTHYGNIRHGTDHGRSLARAITRAVGISDNATRKTLTSLLVSRLELLLELRALAEESLGLHPTLPHDGATTTGPLR